MVNTVTEKQPTATEQPPGTTATQDTENMVLLESTGASFGYAVLFGLIPAFFGFVGFMTYLSFPSRVPASSALEALLWWALLTFALGWVIGAALHWVNRRLITNTAALAGTTLVLIIGQFFGSFATLPLVTPAGLSTCAHQDTELVDWVNGRCSYVFSGELRDASYTITGEDVRTIQDGQSVVQVSTYRVKTAAGEGTITTRDRVVTENTMDPSLVGRRLIVEHPTGEPARGKVVRSRHLAGPLGGKSPTEGFCYEGKLYKAHPGGREWVAQAVGSCPVGDDSVPHLEDR